jgi:exonuclease III
LALLFLVLSLCRAFPERYLAKRLSARAPGDRAPFQVGTGRLYAVLLVSWNVAGRVSRLDEQAERLLALHPDVVCLQELTRATVGRWGERFARAGLTPRLADVSSLTERKRPLAVLTAARGSVETPAIPGLPWPERVLAVRLENGLEVMNVHSPVSPSPGLAKVLTHEAVFRYVTTDAEGSARVLCGDFNTPRREHADGRVWTFARTRSGRLRQERGERWDRAESALIRGLAPHGYRDAFREQHGYERKEPTWEWPHTGGGYRLDHLIASAGVDLHDCHYRHDWRREGLSDHSALVAELSVRA